MKKLFHFMHLEIWTEVPTNTLIMHPLSGLAGDGHYKRSKRSPHAHGQVLQFACEPASRTLSPNPRTSDLDLICGYQSGGLCPCHILVVLTVAAPTPLAAETAGALVSEQNNVPFLAFCLLPTGLGKDVFFFFCTSTNVYTDVGPRQIYTVNRSAVV